MAKKFSLASWNVEHFKGDPKRVKRVIDFLGKKKPDVVALYEVEAKSVFTTLSAKMPSYTFFSTYGPQTMNILVGVKNTLSAFFTQRTEFKSGNRYLRPGALLTLTVNNAMYNILFLHTKSLPEPVGFGLRDDMFDRAFKLKAYLDKMAGGSGKANFMFLGDLNTMGMKYRFKKGIDPSFELKEIDYNANRRKMRRLTKDEPHTWWNGPGAKLGPSDLDHVVASEQIVCKPFNGAQATVLGWPKETTPAAQGRWIDRYSDHGLIYLEVL